MGCTPFIELSSAEQLERAQYFRDGSLTDLEALANERLSGINIFDTAASSSAARPDTNSTRFAALMRDWGR
ncbi:hypothetical protein SAMN05880568_3444 [Microbacterium sp. RURRCA19A]|nr:hypothetical protein SAMN05880568_3444 [Microbacterium sp. RURRCA19A]